MAMCNLNVVCYLLAQGTYKSKQQTVLKFVVLYTFQKVTSIQMDYMC